jgi:hypothetical protein
MRNLLAFLIISILIPLKGISQTSKIDTTITCIPNAQLKQAILLIEEGKVIKQELSLTKQIVKVMEYQLANKDSAINYLQLKGLDWKSLNDKNEQLIINYQKQISNQQENIQFQEKKSEKYRKQRILYTIVAATIGFFITKI